MSVGSSSGRPRSTSRSSSRAASEQAMEPKPEVGAGDDHAGQARMHGELGHGPAGVGDAPVGVERAEVMEQTPGIVERPARRRIEERQVVGRCAPHRQLEREARQVDGDDLGIGVGSPSGLLHLGPEAVGHPRLGSPGAPGALVGRSS